MATDTGNIELDPKYDDYDYPVVTPIVRKDKDYNLQVVLPADIESCKAKPLTPEEQSEMQRGYAGHLTAEQQAQVHLLRMKLEAKGYTKRLDTLTLVGGFFNGLRNFCNRAEDMC